jgi:hypothetical protein
MRRKMDLYKPWQWSTVALLHLSDEKELIPVGVAPRLTIPNNSP